VNTTSLLLGASLGAGLCTVLAAGFSWFSVRKAQAAGRVEAPADDELERIHRELAALSKSLEPALRARQGRGAARG
jgi:hypothetical protein